MAPQMRKGEFAMDDETGHRVGEAKQQWQKPELIDLDEGLTAVFGGLGGLNDGVVEALS